MADYSFEIDVPRLCHEFYAEHGKWPNELHIGSQWRKAYDKIVEKAKCFHKADPCGTLKHCWYMGMLVFYEHWTHAVEWTEETEAINQEMRKENRRDERPNNKS